VGHAPLVIRLPVVGVDPGGRWTGIVLRRGDDICEWSTVTANSDGLPSADYLAAVCNLVILYRGQTGSHPGAVVIAVEGVKAPNPHVGMSNPLGIMGTAMVLGAVLRDFPGAVVVPPGGNGSGPMLAYPEALRPTRGKGAGKDGLRHCRSAWDVAGAALGMVRIGAA